MTLPLTVIGGYLGTGKTSLINHLLRHADGRRLAILVNEFGSVSIDEDLIIEPADSEYSNGDTDSSRSKNLISIAGGCVCCSYGNDLSLALLELNELDPKPDHVLIEASGVALPGAIAASVSLMSGYRVDGIVVLTNTETLRDQAADTYIGDTITRQLEHADLAVLNKIDLVSSGDRDATTEWLEAQIPDANIIYAEHGQLPPEVLLQDYGVRLPVQQSGSHHSDLFKTISFNVDKPVDTDELVASLKAGSNITRAKGFVRSTTGDLVTVQQVGRRVALSSAPPDAPLHFVVIGQAGVFDEQAVSELLVDNFGFQRIDDDTVAS